MRYERPLMKRPLLALVVTVAGIVITMAGCSAATSAAPAEQAARDTAPSFGGAALGTLSYTQGSPDTTFELPKATGGNGPLSYRLTPRGSDWRFDSDARTLSITPKTVGSWDLVYRVEDADQNTADSDADEIRLTIEVGPKKVRTYSGSGNEVFVLNPEGDRMDEEVSLVLASASAQVYVIATNTRPYRVIPRIDPVNLSSPPPPTVPRPDDSEADAPGADANHAWRSHHPSIDDLHSVPARSSRASAAMAGLRPPAAEGDRSTFWDTFPEEPREVPAVARRVVTDDTMSAVFWVADDSWGACEGCVTGSMIDTLANDFLAAGDDNDIHDWVTAIFGAPWGRYRPPLLPPPYGNEIHVLILSTDEEFEGYFDWRHNLLRNPEIIPVSEHSNERLMFFVNRDVVGSSAGGGGDRRTTAARALAHEYQHLIRFHQKVVKNGFDADIAPWLDELTSEVTEDLVAYKLMDHGNRGVRYDDPTAGSPPITRGEYGRYNYFNFLSVSDWDEDAPPNRYQALDYALGSYLALTYGGAPFLAAIAQNEYSGTEAIEAAIAAGEGPEMSSAEDPETTFADVLTNWGIANLLSDDTEAQFPYRYNSGEWSLSEAGGVSFRLGSVNLFNYRYRYGEGPDDHHDGPWLFSVDAFNDQDQAAHSNRYLHLGRQTGTADLHVEVPAGVRVSLVVKE